MRNVYFLLLVITCSNFQFCSAQPISPGKQIDDIDSAIIHNQIADAQKLSDHLQLQFEKQFPGDSYNSERLGLQLAKATILQLKEEHAAALSLLLDLSKKAKHQNNDRILSRTYLSIALIYEIADNLPKCNDYLNRALEVIQKNNLDDLYYQYCIRRSSYFRFTKNLDSAFYYAHEARVGAAKYNNGQGEAGSNLMMGIIRGNQGPENIAASNDYFIAAIRYYKYVYDYDGISSMYANISRNFQTINDLQNAFKYNDSAYEYRNFITLAYRSNLAKQRSHLFEIAKNPDSALFYFKIYNEDFQKEIERKENINIKKLEWKFENDRKEEIIKNKNLQLFFIITIAVLVAIAGFLIILQNFKIRNQNQKINFQLDELTRLLSQKNILLSELQHRVKNNLQHVISILELQKESIDFNNVEELIRENQNRIHSMALLHQKLNVVEDLSTIKMASYVEELAQLVKNSYSDFNRTKILITTECTLEDLSIETALPLGLILVELLSNSIKHSFLRQETGEIQIKLNAEKQSNRAVLFYSDNGIGFDFNQDQNLKGLGIEIIKGLITQINGIVSTGSKNGFWISIELNHVL